MLNSCYRSCAHGQSLLCLQLPADEAKGSIQCEMTLKPRLCVKIADNSNKSYSFVDRVTLALSVVLLVHTIVMNFDFPCFLLGKR